MTPPFEVYFASGGAVIALLAVALVLNRAGLLGGPAWAARLGPWIALLGLCLPLVLVGLVYLGAAALLAWLRRDRAAWDAWPVVEARTAFILVGGALLLGARILIRR